MNPIDLMDAIGNIPKELIDKCLDEDMSDPIASNDNMGSEEPIPEKQYVHINRIYYILSSFAACLVIFLLAGIYSKIHTLQPEIPDHPVQTESAPIKIITTETTTSNTSELSAILSQTSLTESTLLTSTAFQTTMASDSKKTFTFTTTKSASETIETGTWLTEHSSSDTLPIETDLTTFRNEEVTTVQSDITGLFNELSVKRLLLDEQHSVFTTEFKYTVTVCDGQSKNEFSDTLPDLLSETDLSQYHCVIIDTYSTDNMLWSAYVADQVLHFRMTYGDPEYENQIKHICYVIWISKQINFDVNSCHIDAAFQAGVHSFYNDYDSYVIPIELDYDG